MSGGGKYDVYEFWRFDMRVGKVLEAEHVLGARKLIKITVDLGSVTKPQLLILNKLTLETSKLIPH